MQSQNNLFDHLFSALSEIHQFHTPYGAVHNAFYQAAKQASGQLFSGGTACQAPFGPFGELKLPFVEMGDISSLNLFDLDELIIFSFYWNARQTYSRVADIGGNIGLHSILLDRCGYEVRCFEPDPVHADHIRSNLKLNNCTNVEFVEAAVSDHDGVSEFVRVLGNTMSSHLDGAKKNPYGELERFEVATVDFRPVLQWADLIKIDAEGHEGRLLSLTTEQSWKTTDAIVEIGSADNAEIVFRHFEGTAVNLFSQSLNWSRVGDLSQMPISYKDGSLFVSSRNTVPWAPSQNTGH